MALGTATLDFGTDPATEAEVIVSGLSGLAVGTHKEAFAQGDDTTADNGVEDHQLLALVGRFVCEYVSATEMRIKCYLLFGAAAGTFTIHYVTAT
jgi:hypothetical protein